MKNLDITPNKIVISIILIIILFMGYQFLHFVYRFSGDVYMSSEEYIVNKSFNDLDWQIYQFKKTNPQYYLIKTNEKGEDIVYEDHSSNKHYHVFFYWEDKNLTVQCLIDPIDNKNALLSLYAVSKGTNFASWKLINTDDLTKKENKEIKKKFEVEILDKLGKWKHKRWYN